MTETAITPLQRLAKVLQLGTPSMYRNHMYVNGESLYFPTGRVYGGQVIAQGTVPQVIDTRESRIAPFLARLACRIRFMAISFLPVIFVRICCLMWRICVMAARFQLVV